MNGERPVVFHAASAALEGRLSVPAGARAALVMCHPHPQYGGDMDNQVVTDLAAHAQHAGVATLRFNFRGTGGSTGSYANGVGEADDARAAVAVLR
jgi:alpha/beta superfamily hydrolase